MSHDSFYQQLKHPPPSPFKFIKTECRHSPHVLRSQRLHRRWRLRGKHLISLWDRKTDAQTRSHNLPFNFREIFQLEHKGKEAAAPPVTSSFLCNHYWFCIGGGGHCFPQTLRDLDADIGEELKWLQEQPWKLQVNSRLSRRRAWRTHIEVEFYMKFLQTKANPGEFRAGVFKMQPVLQIWSEVSKSSTQVRCFNLEADWNSTVRWTELL